MSRLVDADKVAEAIAWLNEYDFVLWNEIMKCIDKVPTVDAEPVVRCKDCFWCKPLTHTKRSVGACDCDDAYIFEVPLDGYCSKGKRRENATNY